jgi:AraC-like DNA-binding protein
MSELRQFVHQPAGLLRRYVREILWISSDTPRVQTLMPETTLTLAFRQTGSVSLRDQTLPCSVVSGLQQRTRIVEHSAGSSLLVVRFTEIGATAILHQPADELYNHTSALDSLLPQREIDHLQNVLHDTHRPSEQVVHVERFLAKRLRRHNRISPQIEAAVQMIRHSNGQSSVRAIARYVAMSQSALERHFRAAVGTSPKQLSRLVRLQHVCRLWHAGKSLTEIAFAAGYTDQPHMIRDFQLFTGTSPERFFRTSFPQTLLTFYK